MRIKKEPFSFRLPQEIIDFLDSYVDGESVYNRTESLKRFITDSKEFRQWREWHKHHDNKKNGSA